MDDEKEIERLQTYLDELADDGIKAKEKLENMTLILVALAAMTFCTFVALCYSSEKTNERLLRIKKIVQMDEIGRRK